MLNNEVEVHAEVWGGHYGLRKQAVNPQNINVMGFTDIIIVEIMNTLLFASKIGKSTSFVGKQKGLLIIGNGFDLDLKRVITFADFYHSDFWPKDKTLECPLSIFLDKANKTNNWFDLEGEISRYVDNTNNNILRDVPKDLIFYHQLIDAMMDYASSKTIESISKIKSYGGRLVKQVPFAYQVFETVLLNPLYHIYSFNYTDLQGLAQLVYENNHQKCSANLSSLLSRKVEFVHGSLVLKNIIIGSEDKDTVKGLELIRKTNQLRNTKIINDLENAGIVVFFGHSLSIADRCYFNAFFESVKNKTNLCRLVIMITYDDDSMLHIKNNLKKFYGIGWECPTIKYYTIKDYEKQVGINHPLQVLEEIEYLSLS